MLFFYVVRAGCSAVIDHQCVSLVYNVIIFPFLYLDTGFHCHLIRVHVRAGVRNLVYMVQEGDIVTIAVIPTPPDARPTGVGDGDTTNKGRSGGF